MNGKVKTQLNIRVSSATRDKLDWLTDHRYGTYVESIAVAVDRLYQNERRKSMYNKLIGTQFEAAIEQIRRELDMDVEVVYASQNPDATSPAGKSLHWHVGEFPDGFVTTGEKIYVQGGPYFLTLHKLENGLYNVGGFDSSDMGSNLVVRLG